MATIQRIQCQLHRSPPGRQHKRPPLPIRCQNRQINLALPIRRKLHNVLRLYSQWFLLCNRRQRQRYPHLRWIDKESKTCLIQVSHQLKGIEWHKQGHNNRVFSVKYKRDQPDILVSGGWDQNVSLWISRSIYGIWGLRVLLPLFMDPKLQVTRSTSHKISC